MPKQAKGKPAKGVRMGVHFFFPDTDQSQSAALHKHLNDLAPELVKGLQQKTGDNTLAKFNMFKEGGP